MTAVVQNMNAFFLDEVAALEKSCFSVPWSREALKDELNSPLSRFLVATAKGAVCGYICFRVLAGEGEILRVAVDKGFRGRGIGAALVEAALAVCAELGVYSVFLEVRRSNRPAAALYEKFGFINDGMRKNYYNSPKEDALLFSKRLKGE